VTLADETRPAAERTAVWWTLVDALDDLLRLLHPIAPFITEGIWEALPRRAGDPGLLATAAWPARHAAASSAVSSIDQWLDLVREVRAARTTAKLAAGAWIPLTVAAPPQLAASGEGLRSAIERLARVRPLTIQAALPTEGEGLLVVAGVLTARLAPPQADAAALDADRARREKDLAAAQAQLAAAEARLADPSFTGKAPAAVVAGAERRVAELRDEIARLERGS
jgi:valyl-tRNA synthetase